uniref:Ubiquitin-like domain-containing protein n=1 Tax=viral metagenome TaxID=1070528 RepID=A0A6C0KF53_9ZZZZ
MDRYRFVSLYDDASFKPFRVSVKKMSGDMLELSTDPGDTIGNVKDFLSAYLDLPLAVIVLLNLSGEPTEDYDIIQTDLSLNMVVRNEYPELYQLTQHPENILGLKEEFDRLVDLGEDPLSILEDFINGWRENILNFHMSFISPETFAQIRDHAIAVITTSNIDAQKKRKFVDQLTPYEGDDLYDDYEYPYYNSL